MDIKKTLKRALVIAMMLAALTRSNKAIATEQKTTSPIITSKIELVCKTDNNLRGGLQLIELAFRSLNNAKYSDQLSFSRYIGKSLTSFEKGVNEVERVDKKCANLLRYEYYNILSPILIVNSQLYLSFINLKALGDIEKQDRTAIIRNLMNITKILNECIVQNPYSPNQFKKEAIKIINDINVVIRMYSGSIK